jgi:hypothetical protein
MVNVSPNKGFVKKRYNVSCSVVPTFFFKANGIETSLYGEYCSLPKTRFSQCDFNIHNPLVVQHEMRF